MNRIILISLLLPCFYVIAHFLTADKFSAAAPPATQSSTEKVEWGDTINETRLGTPKELPEMSSAGPVDVPVFFENLGPEPIMYSVSNNPPPSDFDIRVISSPGDLGSAKIWKDLMLLSSSRTVGFLAHSRYKNRVHLGAMYNFRVSGNYKLQVGLRLHKENKEDYTVWSAIINLHVNFAASEEWDKIDSSH